MFFVGNYYGYLARLQHKKRKYDVAEALYQKGYEKKMNSPSFLWLYAVLLMKKGDFALSEQIFHRLMCMRRAIKLRYMIQLNLAIITWKQGDTAKAIKTMQQLQCQHESSDLYHALSYILIQNEQFESAERYLQKALTYNDNDPYILCNVGTLYYKQEKYDKAKEYLNKALLIDEKLLEAHWILSFIDEMDGNLQSAYAHMEKALSVCRFSALSLVSREDVEQRAKELLKSISPL